MKILKKMLLIKWYYIEHQLINFDSLNFMTGKNASGKSTIIDAMQIVMLGDTRGGFFNKAANDKGGRTLDGYLKGEISDDGDLGFKSKRNGRFTSYIALEFFDTVERKSITCGIVFDSYKDAPTDHMFFILNDAIPKNHFIDEETNIAMDYKKLKIYFSKNYQSSKYKTYKESNKSYQNDFLAKMGAIKPKFFSLFKKSVTFKPIDDIEKFISEYVCDVTNEIDIEKMKRNIRQYKELEKQANLMQERLENLRKIEELFKSYQNDVEEEYYQKYLRDRSGLEIENNNLNNLQAICTKNKEDIEKYIKEVEKLKLEEEKLEKIKNVKIAEKLSSDINRKQEELNKELLQIENEIKMIEDKTKSLIIRFRNKISKWRVNIRQLIESKNEIQDGEINTYSNRLKDNIEYLLSINEESLDSLDINVLVEMKKQMNEINTYANKIFFQNEKEEKELKNEHEILEKEINNLKSGIKPYKTQLLEFKNEIKIQLEKIFNEKVEVNILADLLEIKDIKWKEAIECYLNSQMFYIIIQPKYYTEATKIYRRISKENKLYNFGIVDVGKIESLNLKIEKNSLAEEIETNNKFARIYIDYLLGKVIKCEKIEELREHKTSITSDCMLYKNYVLRKIIDRHNEFKFIGKNSILEQIKIKEIQIIKIEEKLEKIIEISKLMEELRLADRFNDEEINYILEDIEIIKKEKTLLERKRKIEEELNKLDLTWLDKISQEIGELEFKITNLKNEEENITRKETKLQTITENIEKEKIPEVQSIISNKQKDLELQFLEEWINNFGNSRFEQENSKKSLETINRVSQRNINVITERKNKKLDSVINARSEYTKKYDFSYNVSDRSSNREFSEELEKLEKVELPKYIEKIRDSKDKAYQQFREDFISKLKANIDEVERQIEELNDALKNSIFGIDKYHFNVKPKQEYKKFYDMITDPMLMEGNNLWSEAFNSKYGNEITELFSKLTSSDIYDETYNKNISIYTDYKTYLSFDLIVTDKEGDSQRLSRTLNKKSGGETQTPFYISILASFAQLYRINKNRNDNTLRLIVFDEAFNKMDEERMKESLSLLPRFGLQAIIAAPSEKAGEIIPLVPNTLCVIKKDKNTVVHEWGKDKNALE